MTTKEAGEILSTYLIDMLYDLGHVDDSGNMPFEVRITIKEAIGVFVSLEDRIARLERAVMELEKDA